MSLLNYFKKVEAPLEKTSGTDNVLSKNEMDMIEEVVEKERSNCGKRSREYNRYTPEKRANMLLKGSRQWIFSLGDDRLLDCHCHYVSLPPLRIDQSNYSAPFYTLPFLQRMNSNCLYIYMVSSDTARYL